MPACRERRPPSKLASTSGISPQIKDIFFAISDILLTFINANDTEKNTL